MENGQCVDAMHLQPCHSPIWDTALLINALVEAGMPQDHPALQKASNWLLSKQTTTVGDWIISSPVRNPADGISNSRTSCFRMSTTPQSS